MKSLDMLFVLLIAVLGAGSTQAEFVNVYTFSSDTSNFSIGNYGDSRTDEFADFDGDGYPELFPENGSFLTIVKLVGPTFIETMLWSYTLPEVPDQVEMYTANLSPHVGKEVIIRAYANGEHTLVVSSTGALIQDFGQNVIADLGDFNGDGFEDLIFRFGYGMPWEVWSYTEAVGVVPGPSNTGRLEQNVPNPFNPSTTIAFELPREGEAVLEVFDQRGHLVWNRDLGFLDAGRHIELWDGTDAAGRRVPSGVYHYVLISGAWETSRQMVLVK